MAIVACPGDMGKSEVEGLPAHGCLQPGVPCEVIIPLESYIDRCQSVDWPARRIRWQEIHGRIRPGISIKAAQSELQVLWPAILDDTIPCDAGGERETRFRLQTIGIESAVRSSSRYQCTFEDRLLVRSTIVGLLLIVSISIANLMPAQAALRRHETAVRIAIGAGRSHVLRQSAFGSVLLAIAGAAVGLGISVVASRAVASSWNS